MTFQFTALGWAAVVEQGMEGAIRKGHFWKAEMKALAVQCVGGIGRRGDKLPGARVPEQACALGCKTVGFEMRLPGV